MHFEKEGIMNQEKEEDSEESINNEENDLRFLSEDSFLSRNNNVSVEDIELLPKDIHLKKVYENEYLIHSNIKKITIQLK